MLIHTQLLAFPPPRASRQAKQITVNANILQSIQFGTSTMFNKTHEGQDPFMLEKAIINY